MKRTKRIIAGLLCVILFSANTKMILQVVAEEQITVTEAKSVMYSVTGTRVYNYPDFNSNIVTSVQANLPVEVLGVTSNGWFQINLNGKYYIPANGLTTTKPSAVISSGAYDETTIRKLISGTFSYYDGATLRSFTPIDIEDMDDNEYIKYLDSFLYGNASIDNCIIKESGLTLKAHYDGKAQADATIKGKPLREYLVDYRNKFLEQSVKGPVKTKKNLIQVLNRSIRYDITEFTTIYKNASVGNDSQEMESIIKEVVELMKEEQGIAFTYKISYGNYITSNGGSASGWHIVFSKAK